MKKLPVSVCIVSGAEAHRIRQALESVSARASEIIVVLNEEVADGTDRIAEEFGAKVFREPWRGFIGQKNSVSEKATQPWLFNLDADEVVPPELWFQIAQALENPSATHTAYQFPRCTFYFGRWIRHGDWYPDRVLRIWRRNKAVWAGVDPHACLKVDGTIGNLQSDLLHYSFESISRHLLKTDSYSEEFVRHYPSTEKSPGFFKMVIRPFWRFFRAYCLRLGFLDGWPGYYIAWLSAFSTLTRYAKVREAHILRHANPKTASVAKLLN